MPRCYLGQFHRDGFLHYFVTDGIDQLLGCGTAIHTDWDEDAFGIWCLSKPAIKFQHLQFRLYNFIFVYRAT